MRGNILSLLICSTLLFKSHVVYCQLPALHIVPIDSIEFGDSTIVNFKFIDYNEDQFYDYYVATNLRSYLIDGFSGEILWMSAEDTISKFENLEFIESIGVWRNYVVKKLSYHDYEIMWYDLPDVIPEDSLSISHDYGMEFDGSGSMFIGQSPILGPECIYMQVTVTEPRYQVCLYFVGLNIIYDVLNDSLLVSSTCGMPFLNQSFAINNDNYFLHIGNIRYYCHEHGDYSGEYGVIHLYDEDLDLLPTFPHNSPYIYSSDFRQETTNDNPMLLLSGERKVTLYSNVFDTLYLQRLFQLYTNYAKFTNYENQLKIINGSNVGYFEIWDVDLTFDKYICERMPEGIKNIQTKDIDFDGTDEVFCIYDSLIIICSIEEYIGITENTLLLPSYYIYNYPNPFNSSTNISFSLSEPSDVEIDIYDMLGCKVTTLLDSYMPAGNHSVLWRPQNLSSGIYFYKITAGEYSTSQKMVLLR